MRNNTIWLILNVLAGLSAEAGYGHHASFGISLLLGLMDVEEAVSRNDRQGSQRNARKAPCYLKLLCALPRHLASLREPKSSSTAETQALEPLPWALRREAKSDLECRVLTIC